MLCIDGVCAPNPRAEDLCFSLAVGAAWCGDDIAALPPVDWDAPDRCTSSCGDGFRAGA